MAVATCPECDAEVEVDEVDADIGDELSCPECGENLVISGTDPIEVDSADDDDEEDDDKDDDDELDDELGDEEDEEQEDGDWEE